MLHVRRKNGINYAKSMGRSAFTLSKMPTRLHQEVLAKQIRVTFHEHRVQMKPPVQSQPI